MSLCIGILALALATLAFVVVVVVVGSVVALVCRTICGDLIKNLGVWSSKRSRNLDGRGDGKEGEEPQEQEQNRRELSLSGK